MKNDLRYIRTDKAIMQAFSSLLKRKTIEDITIEDILNETPVSRSTFYLHYHNKYEIYEQLKNET